MRAIGADGGEAAGRGRGQGLLAGVVLPRFLRRPARSLERLAARPVPRRVGVSGLVALFATTAIAGTLIGGHGVTVVSALSAWSGLAIEEVVITGQSEASELDVLDRLAIGAHPSLLTFDVKGARARIEALPWVEQATLTKLYPDAISVEIGERVPFAIWRHDDRTSLVDHAGAVIVDGVAARYAALPLVVGPGAAERAGEFTNMIGAFPDIAWRVRAGAWVSDRRWTLVLDNDMVLILPRNDPAGALDRISRLDAETGLLSREIAAVDLRMDDRLILRLTDDGLAARNALLKARATAAKRTGTNT